MQNKHTINTAASDHVFKPKKQEGEEEKSRMGFFTRRNSKGCFFSSLATFSSQAIEFHGKLQNVGALSSGIHLTYMHIIRTKKAKPQQKLLDNMRREREREKASE